MEFKKFKAAFQKNFDAMVKDAAYLFEVEADKDELWNLYLDSFPEGTNPIYRERREHDCSCCRHFIKDIGAMVVLKNYQIQTIWGFDTGSAIFQPVVDALDAYVKGKAVSGAYYSNQRNVGTDKNHEIGPDGTVHVYEHFHVVLPANRVFSRDISEGDVQNMVRTGKAVFKRSLDDITEEAIATVMELIRSNTLYRGAEWDVPLAQFMACKRAYDRIPEELRDNFAWVESVNAGSILSRIRNHSIGTLLVDVSEGVDLDAAVRKYEAIVAPANYKRPKAIFTKKMLEEARDKITELGYMDSLPRRFATLDDITVNNILFSNRDSAKRIDGAADVFAAMMGDAKTSPKKFSKVEEISIEKFVTDVLPTAQEVEAYLENKHAGNMVSLIAPKVPDSKPMFKWNNGFSWAYTGNMTDSMMKERVKAAGGKVDGVLRFSIQWNDGNEYDRNDLDAHCIEADGNHIFYAKRYNSHTGGKLDVDIINPVRNCPAVENITWPSMERIRYGVYHFFVKQYSNRGGKGGFRAEIEFDGQVYSFNYDRELRQGEEINVADVILDGRGVFTIKPHLDASESSRDVWGIKTNNFVPVSVVMYSPNYWDEQKGIGNKHYFFMLKGCTNPESPNGFYNEYLKNELITHKRVFEALGGKMAVESVEDQLSGIGFSSTKRAELIVKVKGQTERIMKVKF